MSYSVELSPTFKKEAKKLSKKYTSLKGELTELFTDLESNLKQGVLLGNDIYKIRLSIASKGKGKSGGARIITYVKVIESRVVLQMGIESFLIITGFWSIDSIDRD